MLGRIWIRSGRAVEDARVYTPADTAIVTPNNDTPYSFVAIDLRAGIAGPGWKGESLTESVGSSSAGPIFPSRSFELSCSIRADIDNVKKIQAGYRAMTLAGFQNKPAPPSAPIGY